MTETQTITLHCPCEKSHIFQKDFQVKGLGSSVVQVRCPHPQCPLKDQWLSYEIPWALAKNETDLKGGDPPHPPTQS